MYRSDAQMVPLRKILTRVLDPKMGQNPTRHRKLNKEKKQSLFSRLFLPIKSPDMEGKMDSETRYWKHALISTFPETIFPQPPPSQLISALLVPISKGRQKLWV